MQAAISCNGSQWLKRAAACIKVCEDVFRLIHFYLGKHKEFFPHFTVKKSSLLLAAEWLSCLYVQRIAYKYEICKECLWIKSFLCTTGKKG